MKPLHILAGAVLLCTAFCVAAVPTTARSQTVIAPSLPAPPAADPARLVPPGAAVSPTASAPLPSRASPAADLRLSFSSLDAVMAGYYQGRRAEALRRLEELLHAEPPFFPAVDCYGELQRRAGSGRKIAPLERRRPSSPVLAAYLDARIALARRDWVGASTHAHEALARGCRYPGCFVVLAQSLEAQHGTDGAIAELNETTTSPGDDVAGLRALAIGQMLLPHWPRASEAEAALRQAMDRLAPGAGLEEALEAFGDLRAGPAFRPQEAIELYGRALESYDASGDVASVRRILRRMAVAWLQQRNASKAGEALRRVRELQRSPADPLEEAQTRALEGEINVQYRRWPEAQRCYEAALRLADAGADPLERAEILIGLGYALQRAGDRRAARARLEDAMQCIGETGPPRLRAKALLLLAGVHDDPVVAERMLREVVSVCRAEGDLENEAQALSGLGYRLLAPERWAELLEVRTRAVMLFRRTGDTFNEMIELLALGQSYMHVGWGYPDRALTLMRQSLELSEAQGQPLWGARIRDCLGTALYVLGEADAAKAYLEQALTTWRQIGDRGINLVSALQGLARIHLKESEPQAALPLALEAAKAAETHALPLEALKSETLAATALTQLGRPEEAAVMARRVLDDVALQAFPTAVAEAQLALARALWAQGRYEEAIRSVNAALEKAPASSSALERLKALEVLARIQIQLSRKAEAIALVDEALSIVRAQLEVLPLLDEQASYFARQSELYALRVQLMLPADSSREVPEAGTLGETFDLAEKARARSLLLRVRLSAVPTDITTGGTAQVSGASLPDPLTSDAAGEALAEPETVPLARIQTSLSDGTTLIAYLLGKDQSVAWAVTGQDVRPFFLPPEATLSARIESFRTLLADRAGSIKKLESEAARLGETLLGPAAASLKPGAPLVIIPDGVLGALPFEALMLGPSAGKGEKRWLGIEHPLTYGPSASMWWNTRRDAGRPLAPGRLLALGDPLYPQDPCGRGQPVSVVRDGTQLTASRGGVARAWDRLCFSGMELLAIRQSRRGRAGDVDGDIYLEREDATERRLREIGPARFSIFHFSTHGLAFPDAPLRSALVLDQSRRTTEAPTGPSGLETSSFDAYASDGYLEAPEIVRLRLKADLVVLSACETAVGRIRRGDGVDSLARAFLIGGARRVVASHWAVADQTTAEFMARFYRELRTHTVADALFRTRRAFVLSHGWARSVTWPWSKTPLSYAHPFYWAPFVLIEGQASEEGPPRVTPPAAPAAPHR